MRIQLQISGTTPLLQHNEQLADQTNKFARAIAELTAKRDNKTEADNAQISRLEWQGGLYLDEHGRIVVPSNNLVRALREAGGQTKQGKKIAGAVIPTSLYIPLIYDGPTNLDELYADGRFVNSRMVGVTTGSKKSRIKRTRPVFPKWALKADFELMVDIINPSALESIAERTGQIIGLGDGRIIGFGRFEVKFN